MSEAMRPMRALGTECRRGQEPNRAESEETSSKEMGGGQPASGECKVCFHGGGRMLASGFAEESGRRGGSHVQLSVRWKSGCGSHARWAREVKPSSIVLHMSEDDSCSSVYSTKNTKQIHPLVRQS